MFDQLVGFEYFTVNRAEFLLEFDSWIRIASDHHDLVLISVSNLVPFILVEFLESCLLLEINDEWWLLSS